jgi:hypothetical protein
MTTLPTAIIPSRLERLDSKYMARAIQSSSFVGGGREDGEPHPDRTERLPNTTVISILMEERGKFLTFGTSVVTDLAEPMFPNKT